MASDVDIWTWGAKPSWVTEGWTERLAAGILSRFKPRVAKSTERVDTLMDWGPSAYWYVSSVNPAYSNPIIFWIPNDSLQRCRNSGLTPFDTGGIFGCDSLGAYRVVGDPPFQDLDSRRAFVDSAQCQISQFPQIVLSDLRKRWMAPAVDRYKAGLSPELPWPGLSAEISNQFMWTWEGRIAVSDLDRQPLAVTRVFWTHDVESQFIRRVSDPDFRVFDDDLLESDLDRIALWVARNATVIDDSGEIVSQARGAL